MKPGRILIAAGGTGGHLWPAVSLARAIRRLAPEAEFLFVGAGKPVEGKILGPEKWPRAVLKTSGLKGRGALGKMKALAECALAVARAGKIVRSFRPSLCVGTGGYVTVPVGLAARLCGVPLIVQEQNSLPGLSNRLLGKMARKVMLGFPEAVSGFPGHKTVVTGNPVRPEIEALFTRRREFTESRKKILVTGGSQGATALNEIVSKALVLLAGKGADFSVIHQTGEADCEKTAAFYDGAGLENLTAAFFQDMAFRYGEADLAISRAGAISIAELAAAGLPSILVPLPTAADDHQSVNARSLSERGAARLMPQKELTPELLAETLESLLADAAELKRMSEAARLSARLGAADEMAKIALGIIK